MLNVILIPIYIAFMFYISASTEKVWIDSVSRVKQERQMEVIYWKSRPRY